jgi:hypothetical protein
MKWYQRIPYDTSRYIVYKNSGINDVLTLTDG